MESNIFVFVNFSQQKVKRLLSTAVRLKVLWKIWMQMMHSVCCII